MQNPVRAWDLDTITNIMIACIILDNMIVQDEKGEDLEGIFEMPLWEGTMRRGLPSIELLAGVWEVETVTTHFNLRNDLIDHLWALKCSS